ncbi:hypothetical protein AB0F65_17645 [Nocardia rhamnosiphila]|uniref:hypothetical protein n=1 Tax=Nocardia rhamnosiphila TaxID=426716 RepID=UPI0033FBA3C6
MKITHEQTAAIVGVELARPQGEMESRDGWVSIGLVVDMDNGRVRAIPHHNIGPFLARLLAMAEQVAVMGRTDGPEWQYAEGLGYVAGVRVNLARPGEDLSDEQDEEVSR